jgi:hypothetical protein
VVVVVVAVAAAAAAGASAVAEIPNILVCGPKLSLQDPDILVQLRHLAPHCVRD